MPERGKQDACRAVLAHTARLRPLGFGVAAFATKRLAEPKLAKPAKAGGVRSQIRTGLHNLQFPANREFAGNFADSGFRVPIPTLYLTSKISGF
jgi:hypothetical protein